MRWLEILSVLAGVLGIAWVADALVVTDFEKVEAFAEGVRGPDGVNALLDRCDVTRVPVTLIANGRRETYDEGDELALADVVQDEFAFIEDPDEHVDLQSIDMNEGTATVALRGESDRAVRYTSVEMAQRGDGWLVERIRLSTSDRRRSD